MPPTRTRRPKMDNQTARELILAGAAELFVERGYHATSVREIGDKVRVSQSSLYYHAKSKPQILADINELFMSGLIEALVEIRDRDIDLMDKLRAVIDELLRLIAEQKAIVTVVLREYHSLPPAAAKRIERQVHRVDAILDEMLKDAAAEGRIRPLQAPLVRLAIVGMTNWSYTWFDVDGPLGHEEIAETFFDILVNGIAQRD